MGEEASLIRLNMQGNTLTLTVNNASTRDSAHEVYVYLVAYQFLTIRGKSGVDVID